jgi:outer membrane protein OmpA-like peptidoglycan-associated protein
MTHRIVSPVRVLAIATTLFAVHACARRTNETARAPDEAGAGERNAARTELTQAPTDDVHLQDDGVVVEAIITRECGVPANTAYFAGDCTALRPGAEERLLAIAQCLIVGPLSQREIVIVGHTDPTGDEAYNEELGLARARAVREFLRGQGVSSLRMKTVSRGEIEAGDDESAWRTDRKVEITLLPKGQHLYEPSGDPLAPVMPNLESR